MSRQAICLGEILIDCFADQPVQTVAAVKSWSSLPGGAPANVACGLAKLGTAVEFIGAVGNDAWGEALLRLLQDLGVGTRGVQQHPTAPTRQVLVLRDQKGDRSFAGFSGADPEMFADASLNGAAINPELFSQAQLLVLGTLGLAYGATRQAVRRCLQLAQAQRLKVFVDVNWRPMFWPQPAAAPGVIHDLLVQAQFLKLSAEEADWLFGTVSPAEIRARLPRLEGVWVTAGAEGCAYWLAGHSDQLPSFEVDVEDTTGAGDGFVAGLAHQLCQHGLSGLRNAQTVRQLVTYASAVGAITTTRPGAIAALPSAREVEAFLYLQ
ncbi:carbohydrate kinase [Romeria aff. gracilis LEGE 07310]|uniref:Carbohydrate kinase n=1 Tax=Vasconcelosia minhoensis LEGE 07310 TaxID=915328 RepID=A0A8J7DBM3_9CYAN|nr:carbohydrate kinase [Romeria gracilis]MBE9077932.1 carbohydrate kinase [Romeria aff. gracilis LEGE 07310]